MNTFKVWECIVCGWVYDEAKGWPEDGIEPGTRWEDIPEDWLCPECGVGKEDFEMLEISQSAAPVSTAGTQASSTAPAPSPAQATTPATPSTSNTTPSQTATPSEHEPYKTWECIVCGWIYDEAKGWPEDGIEPGTRWEDIPDDWLCPECGVGKEDFEMFEISQTPPPTSPAASSMATSSNQQPAASAAPTTLNNAEEPIVIIGTGLAGYNLARELRKLDTTSPIVMITSDDGKFYSKPLLSTAYHRDKTADELATSSAEQMAKNLSAEIMIFTDVESIDTERRSVVTNRGTIQYKQLVLATGARCIEAPLEGDGLEHVYSINDLLDYARFRTAMVNKKKVLVIGAGLIGSEYANDLIQCGYELEVVDPLDSVLATLLPPEASASLKSALVKKGVNFHFGTVVKSVDKHNGKLRATLANGTTIDTDIVLSAIGVRANVSLAERAGLVCNRGLVTNRQLQTSDPDIYALGDCAEVDGHLLYYIAPLMESARALASTLCGNATDVYYGVMPVTVKTTIFPVLVSPPPRDGNGEWIIEQSTSNGVKACFRTSDHQLLGFALTGDCVNAFREELCETLKPIMQANT